MGLMRAPLASFLLLVLLLCPSFSLSKELEGFGDELEEEFEEEVEEPLPAAPLLRKAQQRGSAFDDSTGDDGSDAEEPVGRQKPFEVSDSGSGEGKGASSFKPASKEEPRQETAAAAESKKPVRDEWDEEEFEGVPLPDSELGGVGYASGHHQQQQQQRQQVKPKARLQQPLPPRKPLKLEDHIPELVFLAFLLIFGINYFVGSSKNEKLALAWADQFTAEGSVFEKNFSLLGTGDSNDATEPLMIKEGQNTFKFYASGRRFCECVLVTLDLRSRHDLLSLAWYLAFPKEDLVKVEVHMNEESMPPFILAVVRRRKAKAFLKEHKDLKEYCSIMDFSSRKKWPADELSVIGDCKEAANEVLSDVILDQLFGEKAFEKFGAEHFVSMRLTDQYPALMKKKVLLFEFRLPAASRMADISKLMASIPYFIDSVARLTLSAQAKAKAEAARSRAQQAAMKEAQEQRQEELLRRREERRRADEARLSPQEVARRREKERQRELRPRARLARIH